jgi:hypothetical protein
MLLQKTLYECYRWRKINAARQALAAVQPNGNAILETAH